METPDADSLELAVLGMRAKPNRPQCNALRFNLKRDSGGIVDGELVVQFGVTVHARGNDDLTGLPEVARLSEALGR